MPPSVLIIEDDPLTRRAVEHLLESHVADGELEVRFVDGAESAREAYTERPADMVVCDLYLPKKDALQLAEELNRITPARFFFVGAGTIDAQLRDRVQRRLRAEVYSKPLELPELVAAMLKIDQPAEDHIHLDDVAEVGALGERGVPEVLLDLWESRRTGVLDLVRGRVQKKIVLRRGAPVAVASNLRAETLGHFLVQRKLLTEAQHQAAVSQSQRENERLGRVLVRQGILEEQQLLDELAAQMRHKLVGALRWRDGTYQFEPGEPDGGQLELPFETPRLIFSGLRRTARLDEIVPRLRAEPARFYLSLRAERHRATLVRMFGADFFALLDQRPLVAELVAHREASKLLVLVDVLLRCGCAELESLGPGAAATPARDPLALIELGRDRSSTAPAPTSSEHGLFADPETGVRAQHPHLLDPPSDEDSDVLELPSSPTLSSEELRALDPDGEALRREVLSEYLSIHAKDHYQLLGVARDAVPQDIALAHAAISRRFRFERFAKVELGRDYARLEEIAARVKNAFETLNAPVRRQAYDATLQSGVRRSDGRLDAEVLSHQGQTKLERGEYAAAREKLVEAIAADAEQPDYHALLGWATYLNALGPGRESAGVDRIRAAAVLARPHLENALLIEPDHTDAHDFAGRIDAAEGNDAGAIEHLEVVLDHAPARAETLTLLEAALGRRGEWRRLEQLYRRLIHRLSSEASERPLLVWWRLAELYRTRLDDPAAAQVAYETVARLAPDDPRPRRALAALLHRDDSSPHAASALRESWRLEPEDPSPGVALFAAHLAGERWDAALIVAMALACRGAGDADAAHFLRSHRPRFLVRAQQVMTNAVFDVIRHPDDDASLGALFAEVFAVSSPEITLDTLAIGPSDLVSHDALPDVFSRALSYVAHELSTPPPAVYVRNDFGAEIHVGAARPPVLLVGPQALTSPDLMLLTFRVARALSYVRNGRAITGALPTSELKDHLGAALTLAQPGMRFDDPEGRVAELRVRLSGRATSLARALRPAVEALLAVQRERIHLGHFVTGMARTADRVGLLLCNDLPTAARVVGNESAPGAEDELIDFALGDTYLDARTRLGLAIAV